MTPDGREDAPSAHATPASHLARGRRPLRPLRYRPQVDEGLAVGLEPDQHVAVLALRADRRVPQGHVDHHDVAPAGRCVPPGSMGDLRALVGICYDADTRERVS